MSRRRSQIRFPFLVAVLSVAVTIAAYVFALPQWQTSGDSFLRPVDLYVPRAIDVIVVVWCFWVGSSIGSFLNVVAWRMPRGESINGRSHCPRCCAQLRARDNLPVFGWLALGGRCHSCHLPISIRYPLVEGAVGLSITAICVAELYQLNLPGQIVHSHRGPLRAPVVGFEVLAILLYHVVALSTAWACGLIRLDGNRLPKRLVIFAAIALVIPMLVYPTLMVVPWQIVAPANWEPTGLYLDAVVRVVTALAAATVLGRYLARAFCPNADPKLDPLGRSTARLMDLIVILSIPSIVVGWQALIGVTAIASIVAVALNFVLGERRVSSPPADLVPDSETALGRDPETLEEDFGTAPLSTPSVSMPWEALGRFAIAIPITLALQIVFWRHLHTPVAGSLDQEGSHWWPSDGVAPWVLLSWVGVVFLIPFWLRDSELDAKSPQPDRNMPDRLQPEPEREPPTDA